MLLYLSIHKETGKIMAANTSYAVRMDSDLFVVEVDEIPANIYDMEFIKTGEPLTDEQWFQREWFPLLPSGYLEVGEQYESE